MTYPRITADFFDRDAQTVACDLLGKVLCHCVDGLWLSAMIVETEAYYRWDKASHASLGYTEKRRALFMPPGTVYMYYARGGDSFNVSCRGEGNAVLVKAGLPYPVAGDPEDVLARMRVLNPLPSGAERPLHRLCAGQTLLCRALGLKVRAWDGRPIDGDGLRLLDLGTRPEQVIRTTRLGIAPDRDPHHLFRFIAFEHAHAATENPLKRRRSAAARPFEVLHCDGRSIKALADRDPPPED